MFVYSDIPLPLLVPNYLQLGVLIGQLCSCHGAGDMNEGDRSTNKVLMDTCT